MCYYFDDIIKVEDFDFDNALLDEKSYENVLIYDTSFKTLIGARPLRIRFTYIKILTGYYPKRRSSKKGW